MVASMLMLIALSSVALCVDAKSSKFRVSVRDGFVPRQGTCVNKCGNSLTPYNNCSTPVNCGPVPNQACGCSCAACGSCVVAPNPVFTKACQANVVLVIDNSFSIKFFNAVDDVVTGAKSFWNNFAQVNQIGGEARLSVVQFSTKAEIVNAGQSDLNEMKELDAAWLRDLNRYIDPTIPKPPGYSVFDPKAVCDTPSCTNWGDALKMVKETPWCVRDATNTCVETKPDIVVWFTDGAPTIHDGTCDWDCNANSVRSDGAVLGPGQGGDLGPACYYADLIKKQQTKIFLIGVGQAADNVKNIQTVTGPVAWNQSSAEGFATSDYILTANYGDLGAIFFNVARGLCKCLQDQKPCENFDPPTNATIAFPNCVEQEQFDARLRVTTGAQSHNYPANSKSYGWIYYSFSSKPPLYAVELQTPGSNFTTLQSVVKTDLYDACSVSRKEKCVSGCFAVTDKSFLPRFFISLDDAPRAPVGGLTSNCGTPYIKSFAPAPESIEYIWITTDSQNRAQICAGRALDGTLYEFFRNNDGSAPGVNLRPPVHLSQSATVLYDFNQFDQCAAIGKCSSSLDVLYVVDRNFDQADYGLVKEYIVKLMNSYNATGGNIRGAIYFEDSSLAFGFTTNFVQLIDRFVQVPNLEGQEPNFYQLVTNAINAYWPTNVTEVPRYMITIVGGPSSAPFTKEQSDTFKFLKRQRHVESWAVGVGAGANQLAVVNAIGDLTAPSIDEAAYDHVQFFGDASILDVSVVDQGIRMCATQSLCDPTCQGLCVCGQCLCAACVTPNPSNLCETACCDASSQLCTVTKKELTVAPLGCVPQNFDQCTKYTCEPTTGNCAVDATCVGKCGCASNSKCSINRVNTSNCGAPCDLIGVTCGCGNQCGSVCNEDTGLCGGAKECNDGNGCTTDTCIVKNQDGVPVASCLFRNDTQRKCPNNEECSYSTCVSTGPSSFFCRQQNITSLIDFCGTCNGNNSGCFFVVPVYSYGPVIGGAFAAGLAIAAIAAAIAGLLALNRNKTPDAVNPLQDQALNDNPAFVAPGIAGEMPAA